MPRPRFHRLAPEQQATILDTALDEFAAHGFRDASLNRIIAAAGISKGSMYYYFDGKEDLYIHVIRAGLEQLLVDGGGAPVPAGNGGPDAFWASLEQQYLQLMRTLAASPRLAGLLRDWLSGTGAPALGAAQRDAEQATLPWLQKTLATGQAVGAVRTDLPPELIIALAMGMGQAIDTWLITRPPGDEQLAEAVRTLMDAMRRALQP
ncbi:TetR/AcrR family transcriptional regulator [Microbacterium sp. SD291]|uniref:TetR/AcrR family transcriptional regulator n=1 Tax=Microbacterium sp. SD291 TaxID=2782007 RepID=UPI001A965A9F|nr:TetR/AcrR family transcriptional regulator [Microbacterium sp. SD291]MBO0980155.1 TetR/AcrR family transcriptional regulator [Microbacterium sp. SD291]